MINYLIHLIFCQDEIKKPRPVEKLIIRVQKIAKHFKRTLTSFEKLMDSQEIKIKSTRSDYENKIDRLVKKVEIQHAHKNLTESEKNDLEENEKTITQLKGGLSSIRRMKGVQFKLNCVTRWNSAFQMLQRALLLRKHAESILLSSEKSKVRSLVLSEREWSDIKEIIEVLEPFMDTTVKLSSSTSPTASLVLPHYRTLLVKTKRILNECQSKMARTLAGDILASLKYRWVSKVRREGWHFSSALDPKFKHLRFLPAKARTEIRKALEDLVAAELLEEKEETSKGEKSPNAAPKDDEFDYGLVEEDEELEIGVLDDAEDEQTAKKEAENLVNAYLAEHVSSTNMDLVEYWTTVGAKYGVLAKIGLKYASAQASSTASERLFSSSGIFVSKRSASMSDSTLNALVFLKEVMKHPIIWRAIKEKYLAKYK